MRIGNRITGHVSRWREALAADDVTAERMRPADIPSAMVRPARIVLDQARAADRISPAELATLTAILLNPDADTAEVIVLRIALAELHGHRVARSVLLDPLDHTHAARKMRRLR